MGSEVGVSSGSRDAHEATPVIGAATTSTAGASACDAGASWGARNDFALERSPSNGDFVDAVSALIRQSGISPIAVSSRMDPGCVWMVAFSATEDVATTAPRHATTFTPMFRHPAGLWTAAPQSTGWLRIVDGASHAVWIPIVDATGSASYGETACTSLSAVRVSATIPASAGDLSLMTAEGPHTVRALLGSEPSSRGWEVRFVFSADILR